VADRLERLKEALAGRYAVLRELGAGGMATVYVAEDLKHHRKVAVKVLRPELAAAAQVPNALNRQAPNPSLGGLTTNDCRSSSARAIARGQPAVCREHS
jgi:serine/threonine protein kinase